MRIIGSLTFNKTLGKTLGVKALSASVALAALMGPRSSS